ncbi:MAG TPA: 2Fe-2S iron-sulfur cluster-binding protein [Polyangiaceae bacterium]|nr:2Fe-2S iron-sulfur cluster-binding protein [Polyangiaceae bacterium]
MPTFKLDNREIPFQPGDTIIRAAHRAGIDIPHYCWHPGLSVAANCRMCLVEVMPPPGRPALNLAVLAWDAEKQAYVDQKKPKLQPACQMTVTEGLDVRSDSSEHVERARSAVQELLLLNHPVDCPICDQAGECRLQDYWLEHQHAKKRMNDEPVHKPKAVVFGPTIVYDAERCIVCTRCVRFCDEVAKDPVLDVRQRGNLNEITVAPGRQLDHPYTLMTEYVCPVGALTATDFRFKARVWFLRSARTVCQGCATGCNAFLDYDPRNDTAYRHRPRENAAVNGYWMCDEGMLDYRRVHQYRVLKAKTGKEETTLSAALDRAADTLKGVSGENVAVVLSAQHSSEDNFAMARFARDVLGTTNVFLSGKPPGEGDSILRNADKNPNQRGMAGAAAGLPAKPIQDLPGLLESGQVKTVVALGADARDVPPPSLVPSSGLVVLATHAGTLTERATVLLPASSWAESDGTFVNAKGLAQESEQAFGPLGDSRPAWKLVAGLSVRLGKDLGFRKLADVRKAMTPEPPQSLRPIAPPSVGGAS